MQDLGHQTRIASDQIEEATAARSSGQGLGGGVATLQDRQLLALEPERRNPRDRVRNRCGRLLASRGRRDDKSRAGTGCGGKAAILLLVAGVELVPSDQREYSRHVRSI